MKLLMFFSAAAATSLCGNWMQTSSGSKCSDKNGCCVPEVENATIPSCPANPVDDNAKIITEETYSFAGNGEYSVTFRVATGQSCPLSASSGTIIFEIVTQGTYTQEGDNIELGSNWGKVTYTPKRFVTKLLKTNQKSPFTAGVATGAKFLSPCTLMTTYLNNLDVGCPCNSTWDSSPQNKTIEVSKCPLVNSTNGSMVSSCPEAYFFNTASKYGNIRISNQTDNNSTTFRLLEITQPMPNSTLGYNSSTVYANFTADFACPSTVGAPTMAKSAAFALAAPCFLLMFFVMVW